MGGIEYCSEASLQLIRRFAASSVLAEQMEAELANGGENHIAQHALLCITVRISTRVGINRRAKQNLPTLSSTLRGRRPKSRQRRERVTTILPIDAALRDPSSWARLLAISDPGQRGSRSFD